MKFLSTSSNKTFFQTLMKVAILTFVLLLSVSLKTTVSADDGSFDYYGGGYTTYDNTSDYYGGGYTTYDNTFDYYGGGYTTYDNTFDYYGGGYTTYDNTFDYYGGGYTTYDNTFDYYGGGYTTYDNAYPQVDQMVYVQDTYSMYQDQPYYVDYGYGQDYYSVYQDPYYSDYGFGGCTSNCGGGYNPAPRYDDLDVVCSVSDRTVDEGDSVTFTADADGGRGSYTYRWSGDVSGTDRTITEEFNDSEIYFATVRVTDRDGRTATANCASVTVGDTTDDDLDVSCRVSDASIEEGDTVRFTAEVDGGNGPYEYDWSGDVDEDSRTFTERFNDSGTYEIDIEVTDDDGDTAQDTCTVRVRNNSTSGTLSSNRLDYPNGNLASVGSVYLNQIPYTGPEDTAKGIAFVVGILVWSIAGALIIRNKMNKKAVANRIEAFKNSNRTIA